MAAISSAEATPTRAPSRSLATAPELIHNRDDRTAGPLYRNKQGRARAG